MRIDESYDILCKPIEAALRRRRLDASRGALPGAFCDGRHNIQISNRKFTGTAQRRKPCRDGSGQVTVLNHALMLVHPLTPVAFEAFRSEIGAALPLDASMHGHLPSAVDLSAFLSDLHNIYTQRVDPVKPPKLH